MVKMADTPFFHAFLWGFQGSFARIFPENYGKSRRISA